MHCTGDKQNCQVQALRLLNTFAPIICHTSKILPVGFQHQSKMVDFLSVEQSQC